LKLQGLSVKCHSCRKLTACRFVRWQGKRKGARDGGERLASWGGAYEKTSYLQKKKPKSGADDQRSESFGRGTKIDDRAIFSAEIIS